ncbi:hypothetical protein FQN60_005154 [Etheostoma spectabile]|uniref:Uncharacterized protein n=1 Tax=Etheostoma spectabile TaxID=54343 RepID=A0A5J5DM42_9PERO|nr:hypothetical protein FQN60_005154 [Etheostoma spectabile]
MLDAEIRAGYKGPVKAQFPACVTLRLLQHSFTSSWTPLLTNTYSTGSTTQFRLDNASAGTLSHSGQHPPVAHCQHQQGQQEADPHSEQVEQGDRFLHGRMLTLSVRPCTSASSPPSSSSEAGAGGGGTSWWCVLKDDWHEGLANGALPSLGHLTPNAAVGSYLAGGGRGRGESLGVAGGQRGESVGVLPYEVAHSACDKLEAVRICAWGDESEVASRAHL